MTEIEAVIFDWGGVLIEDPAPGLIRFCAKALAVEQDQYRRAYAVSMEDFQTGRITERQFWANMTRLLGVPMPKSDSLWAEAFAAVYIPRPELFELASQLRKTGCKIALLSNTEKPAVEFFRKQNYDVFDVTVFSCLEGTKKPEPRIYKITLNRLGTTPANTLFIDDRPDYVDAAKQLGLQTILFKDVNRLKKEIAAAVLGRQI